MACGWQIFNILNWNRMLISMVKPKWILQLCWKCFYSGLHMTLECRDTKLWPVSGCYHNVSTLKGRVNKFYWKLAITPYFSTQGDGNSILQLPKNHHEAARLIPHKWVKKRKDWQKKRTKSRSTFLITKKHTRGKQGLFAIPLQRKPTNFILNQIKGKLHDAWSCSRSWEPWDIHPCLRLSRLLLMHSLVWNFNWMMIP
jgi:hypothetical protein